MGEVWQARDTTLDRDVALKVLPEAFTSDPDRLARFEREAKVLASLNHPNIGSIYGLEEAEGIKALVLELVEGPTLADRIKQGPIPIDEALPIAKQIAEALEAAHEQGVIHRDLKPANIKVKDDGTVKVLDFGLAKALDPNPEGDPSESPTLTAAATQMGVIMGTAAYMSPEQASGQTVNRRSDLWAYGAVVFEMLTGRRAFDGESVSQVLAEVLKGDPDWTRLPLDTADSVRRLLRRCLTKDRTARIGDASTARLEIDEALAPPLPGDAGVRTADARPVAARPWVAAAVAVSVGAVLLVGWSALREDTPARVFAYYPMSLPADQQLVLAGFNNPVVLSPDGSQLAFVGRGEGGSQLYLKPRDEFGATAIPATEGATFPFFSPDGRWLGFFASHQLRKVPVSGGAPITICAATGILHGATWGPDNTIVFSFLESGLRIVSADGGVPETLTEPDVGSGQVTHGLPRFLPDGSGVLFTVHMAPEPSVALLSLETREWEVLLEGGAGARWSPTGHLLFGHNGTVLAVPFDIQRRAITGSSVPVIQGVYTSMFSLPYFTVSAAGTLVYVPSRRDETMVWVDPSSGIESNVTDRPDTYEHPRVSPDGRRVAYDIGPGDRREVWIFDRTRGFSTRLTFEGGNFLPLWTPDGEQLVFGSTRTGSWDIFSRSADGSGEAVPLMLAPYPQVVSSFAPDGTLGYYQIHPETGRDIWVLPPGEEAVPLLVTESHEAQPSFSPDGRWIAYSSDLSGRSEIYLRPYPGPGAPEQISTDGGMEPIWSQTGDAVLYRTAEVLWSVAVATTPDVVLGVPEIVFEGAYDLTAGGDLHYSATPDRGRFLMVTENSATQLRVILNWFDDIENRLDGAP